MASNQDLYRAAVDICERRAWPHKYINAHEIRKHYDLLCLERDIKEKQLMDLITGDDNDV